MKKLLLLVIIIISFTSCIKRDEVYVKIKIENVKIEIIKKIPYFTYYENKQKHFRKQHEIKYFESVENYSYYKSCNKNVFYIHK